MAAERRAAGVMRAGEEDADGEDDPHGHEHERAGEEGLEAAHDGVRGRVDEGVHEARHDEEPGQDHEEEVGLAGDEREGDERVEEDRRLELVVEGVRDLRDPSRPGALRRARCPSPAPRPARSAAKRARPIQNSSAKVSATWTKTGARMAGMARRRCQHARNRLRPLTPASDSSGSRA